MKHLIEVLDNEARVSHRVIAKFTEKKDVAVANIINKYRKDLVEFDTLHFKNEGSINNGKGEQPKTYYLNEQQATFLMTLLRNKPVVIEFKKRLVQEFYKLKENQGVTQIEHLQKIIAAQQLLLEHKQTTLPKPTKDELEQLVQNLKTRAKKLSDQLYIDICANINGAALSVKTKM